MSSDASPQDIDNDNPSQSASNASHGKRETLTSRAKRIIGRALETPKENNATSSSSGGPTHKGPPKKAPTKRREQVLAAQRTHRQRTQGYIKELEKEVMRIRDSENQLKHENERLQKNAQIVELYMTQNNIPFPDGYVLSSTGGSPFSPGAQSIEGSLTFNGSSNAATSPNIFASDTEASPTYGPWGNFSPTSNVNVDFANLVSLNPIKPEPKDIQFESPVEYSSPKSSLRPQLSTDGTIPPAYDTQMALDFVMELERICFAHIKQQYLVDGLEKNPDIPDENFGPNHVYMATSNIINHQIRLPPIKSDPQSSNIDGVNATGISPSGINQPFSMPVIDLDALLKTSLAVDFGTDVTPIQIWANISRLANKGWIINKEIIASLAKEMHKYMRCNGYGAVAEKSIVKQVFAHYFPGEEYLDLQPSQTL